MRRCEICGRGDALDVQVRPDEIRAWCPRCALRYWAEAGGGALLIWDEDTHEFEAVAVTPGMVSALARQPGLTASKVLQVAGVRI